MTFISSYLYVKDQRCTRIPARSVSFERSDNIKDVTTFLCGSVGR